MATIVPGETAEGLAGWVAAALALAIAAVAARAFVRLRGTTLAAPAAWAVAAALVLGLVEAALAYRREWESALGGQIARYGAGVGTFCPLMAVLGAKRPQDRGWQWVVLSLWMVLLVPAGQAWAARSGGEFTLPLAWSGLLWALLTACPLNYLPTRWAPTAIVFAMMQISLLIPRMGSLPYDIASTGALGFLLAVLVWQIRSRPRISAGEPATQLERFSRRWLAFRNGWGAFWGLRVLNRMNETAELSDWPVRLQWGGFAPIDGAPSAGLDERVAAQIELAMDSLLRRFERPEQHSA